MDALELKVAVLEIVQHTVGQAVVGDAVPHHAADLIPGIKNGDIIAPARQQYGNGQPAGPAPTTAAFMPFLGAGPLVILLA